MTLSHQSSTQPFGTVTPYSSLTSAGVKSRPYSAQPLHATSDASFAIPIPSKSSKHFSLQGDHSLLHKESIVSIVTNATSNYTITTNSNNTAYRVSQIDLERTITDKNLIKQLKQQQKKALPLFPTERTRGIASMQNVVKPVDITNIDLFPIEFSRKIIMSCIDEIRLRGLKHKHLFRNPFYSPSVESILTLLLDPKKCHLFSVKMMRIDTVGGLLTTMISRTYPSLIPPELHDLFQTPNGYFCFELLRMLPEINRLLVVEILNLCCDLVDNQLDNLVSCSKLSVYPGSCCFGLNEVMPTWDTRYLLASNVTLYSEAFYHIIYGYCDERYLSDEELEQKRIKRNKVLADERREALELLYGLVGAHDILKREARIAKGLPPDSPELPELPSDVKVVSLYADRSERVVADDAISVLNIQLDDKPDSQKLDKVQGNTNEDEENIESVLADLRKSVSVATLGSRFTAPVSKSIYSASTTSRFAVRRSTAPIPASHSSIQRPGFVRAKTSARFGSIAQNIFPVSPSDIFGTSRHAIARRELQDFLSVARTNKRRRSVVSKRIKQLRLQHKRLRNFSVYNSVFSGTDSSLQTTSKVPICAVQRVRDVHTRQRHLHGAHPQTHALLLKTNFSAAQGLRRERTRQLRKDIEIYQSRGLSAEEAIVQREADIKKRKRREKRARAEALARAEAAAQAKLEMEAAVAEARRKENVTMEEAEILEAFDYLTDEEFKEFMTLAGLTMQDVERIREKAAKAALDKITKDIQSADNSKSTLKTETGHTPEPTTNHGNPVIAINPDLTNTDPTILQATFGDGYSNNAVLEPAGRQKDRPNSISHMTSMDLLLRNANMIGDSNLRCYPIQPSTDVSLQGGHQPQTVEVLVREISPKEEVEEVKEVTVVKTTVQEVKEETATAKSVESVQSEPVEETKVETSDIEPTKDTHSEPVQETKVETSEIEPTEDTHREPVQETKNESSTRKPIENNQSEPSQERTSEDSTASSTETIVGMTESMIDFRPKGLRDSTEQTKALPRLPKSSKDLAESPEPTKDLPQLPKSSKKPQGVPESKLATKATPMLKQNILRFEQSIQQKQQKSQEKIQPGSISKLNISKFSAPTPAPASISPSSSAPTRVRSFALAQTPAASTKSQISVRTQPNTPAAKTAITKIPGHTSNVSKTTAPTATKSPILKNGSLMSSKSLDTTKTPVPAKVLVMAQIPTSTPSRLPVLPRTPTVTTESISKTTLASSPVSSPTSPRAKAPIPNRIPKPTSASALSRVPSPVTSRATSPAPASLSESLRISDSALSPTPVQKRVAEVAIISSTRSANNSTDTLQLLDAESESDDDGKTLTEDNSKDINNVDEEEAELRELLKTMTKEERQEFLRLSK
ncbi:hypothetical protein BGZ46_010161 [Entomortierella lignicola]|nr:hypothetical protein BGZ46_010161 [Entomortierella lignicola]